MPGGDFVPHMQLVKLITDTASRIVKMVSALTRFVRNVVPVLKVLLFQDVLVTALHGMPGGDFVPHMQLVKLITDTASRIVKMVSALTRFVQNVEPALNK